MTLGPVLICGLRDVEFSQVVRPIWVIHCSLMPVFHCFGVEEWIELRNIYTLLERLKMILHKLVTKGLSCEFSARDYSHRLAFMTGTPQKQPAPTDGRLSLVKTVRNSLFVIPCRRPFDPWSHLWVCTTLPGADNWIGSWCDQSTLPWKLFRTTKSLLCEPSDVSFLVAR